jgi:phospholipid/cholesterol/gamma-HCH transport system substrate-binding protein
VHRDLAGVTRASARRRRNLRRLVRSYGLLTRELGRAGHDIVRVVGASNSVFEATAAEQSNLSRSVAELPGALHATRGALVKVTDLGRQLRPTLESLRPAVRSLDPATQALLPLVREGTPILKNRIRPFTRLAGPEVENLGVGAHRLVKAAPDLTKSLTHLNRLLNILALNPGGKEGLTGDLARDRARQEGYLYWFAWNAQAAGSLFGTADGQGIFRRFTFVNTDCAVFTAIGLPAAVVAQLQIAGFCSG